MSSGGMSKEATRESVCVFSRYAAFCAYPHLLREGLPYIDSAPPPLRGKKSRKAHAEQGAVFKGAYLHMKGLFLRVFTHYACDSLKRS